MKHDIGFEFRSTRQAAGTLNDIPNCGGVYMFVMTPGVPLPADFGQEHTVWSDGVNTYDVLYLGATEDSLRTRIKRHLSPRSEGSTMRMSLGLILREQLGIEVQLIHSKRYFYFSDEAVLTEWLCENTYVAFCTAEKAFEMERAMMRHQAGLLNISGAPCASSIHGLAVLRREYTSFRRCEVSLSTPPRPGREPNGRRW